jgi:hypothetical protein
MYGGVADVVLKRVGSSLPQPRTVLVEVNHRKIMKPLEIDLRHEMLGAMVAVPTSATVKRDFETAVLFRKRCY